MLRGGVGAALAAGLVAVITASPAAHAGKLGKANDRIQGSSSSSRSSSSSKSSNDSDDDDDDDSSWSSDGHTHRRSTSSSSNGDEFLATLCLLALPWCVPYVALETGPERRKWAYEPYPYAGGSERGYIYRQRFKLPYNPESDPQDATDAVDETPAPPADEPWDAGTQKWSFRPSGEASYVFDSILRARVAARFLTPSRLELDGAISFFAEQLEGSDVVETALLGRGGLSVRFAQESAVQFRTGVSILHWNYEGDQANGVAASYGFDFFPGEPVIGSVDLLLGVLGPGKALFFEGRGTLGVSLGRAEVYVGYDFVLIEDVDLGGPLMGVRLWL